MNIGIIGTGSIASVGHAPAISEVKGAELVAILSRSRDKGQDFLRSHGSSGVVYPDITAFVSDANIELAIICSPDAFHYSQAKACLESGKHVLLEKPMTLEVSEAEELTELAKEKGLTLGIGFHLRSHVGHQLLKEKIDTGAIGDLRHIRILWAWPAGDDNNWRAHSDLTKWWSLSAVGSHCLDLARWFAGDSSDPAKLNATLANNLWLGPHDETAIVSGQFANGVTFEVVSSVQFGPQNSVELFGSNGTALCSDTLGRSGAGQIKINNEEFQFVPQNPFTTQLKNVITSIENNTPLSAPADAGARSVKDLNQILRLRS